MKVELDIQELTKQKVPGPGSMPCWAQDNQEVQDVFVIAKAEFPHLDDETIWSQIKKELANMGDENQYLGNDSEVVNIPQDQGSDPNAGWGSDDAVVNVPTDK